MRKRILSLLCVLALCLGLLPVTALAVGGAPSQLYVGDQQVSSGNDITYWTTDEGGNLTQSADNQSWNVKYDPTSATLTLSGATIKGDSDVVSIPYGSGIYAQGSSNQPVTLTIELIGENTITGTFGIYVNATPPTTPGTDASLVIKKSGDNGDNGSLTVTGTGNSGLHIISGTGDASLTIKNVSVVANATSSYSGSGVCVQSGASATDSPNISLSVDGGSLTASGTGSRDGILFYVGSSQATGATTSLTVSENAIVDARNGGISALKISETLPTPTPTGDNRSGIVFDGSTGTVYGTVALQNELTIGEGESLTVPEGSSLNCNGKLTNNGTILASGGTVTGSLSGGSEVTTPSITAQPTDQTVTEGQSATFTVEASAGSETPTYQWQQKTAASGSDWTDISQETSASYTISSTTTSMSGNQYRCVVKSASGVSVISSAATLTVQAKPAPVSVTGVSLDKATLELYTGDTATLTATVQPSNATNQNVTWQSDNANVATVEGGTVTAVGAGETDITVTTEDGGKTATCHVTVTQSAYSISADTTALNFGSVYTGYAQPAAKEVTITNTGNRPQTLTLTASTGSFEVGTLTKTQLAAGEKATFTVQPKAGLAVGTYSENITVSGTGGATVTIPASFTVEQRDNTPYYGITVNAPANGTVTCYAKSAAKGAEVTLTVKPDVGYALDKLTVTDASGKAVDVTKVDEKTYTFVMPGSKVTVEAVFAPSTSGLPFTDVSAGDWFYEAVQFVYENGLMDGVAGNLFAPNATLNRAMAVTILYRLEGSPDLDGENLGYPFADVDGNAWYGDAVYWARCNGIVDGVENNHFDPTGSLTREQMATVLYRYAQYKGADVSASGDISGFVDSANVSDWAVDAVKWAVGTGLVNGVEGNALAPQGTSTRAQTAAILARFCGSVI